MFGGACVGLVRWFVFRFELRGWEGGFGDGGMGMIKRGGGTRKKGDGLETESGRLGKNQIGEWKEELKRDEKCVEVERWGKAEVLVETVKG
ncbi:hypothetical protein Tco_1149754 [Tanacetum coccineum]